MMKMDICYMIVYITINYKFNHLATQNTQQYYGDLRYVLISVVAPCCAILQGLQSSDMQGHSVAGDVQ